MEIEDDYRLGQEIEPDSDVDDPESESQLSQWLGELENYAKVSHHVFAGSFTKKISFSEPGKL